MFRWIYTLLGAIMLSILTFFYLESKEVEKEAELLIRGNHINSQSPPCLQMYYYIEKYSEEYGIPKNYAYGVAWKETRYEGPLHWSYKHSQESFAGAVGPMQIMVATARSMWKGDKIQRETLKTDIRLNVETSMKLLRHLHDRYKDWKIVFGCYNTGKPMINQYAIDVYNFKIS